MIDVKDIIDFDASLEKVSDVTISQEEKVDEQIEEKVEPIVEEQIPENTQVPKDLSKFSGGALMALEFSQDNGFLNYTEETVDPNLSPVELKQVLENRMKVIIDHHVKQKVSINETRDAYFKAIESGVDKKLVDKVFSEKDYSKVDFSALDDEEKAKVQDEVITEMLKDQKVGSDYIPQMLETFELNGTKDQEAEKAKNYLSQRKIDNLQNIEKQAELETKQQKEQIALWETQVKQTIQEGKLQGFDLPEGEKADFLNYVLGKTGVVETIKDGKKVLEQSLQRDIDLNKSLQDPKKLLVYWYMGFKDFDFSAIEKKGTQKLNSYLKGDFPVNSKRTGPITDTINEYINQVNSDIMSPPLQN